MIRNVYQAGLPGIEVIRNFYQAGIPVGIPGWTVWQQAIPPPPRWRILSPPRPPRPRRTGRLNFACWAPGFLNFGAACWGSGPLWPLIRRSYLVRNTASLIRIRDEVDIPVTQLTVALDINSWCWTLRARLPLSSIAGVPTYPGTVRATINGFAWDFIVDDLNWNRTFGAGEATLNGRSPAARYAAPYALARSGQESALRTAEQQVQQALGPGWSLDWQLPEWTIPGGTLIEIMLRVVKAAGGWLAADPQAPVLHVVPKWQQKPWAWSFAPDLSLPASYVLTETQQLTGDTAFESILISGGKEGWVVLATRAGTGGTTTAPAVVDRLITDVPAAAGRATQELADLWPLKHYTLTLPLQATPAGSGVLLPGTTLDFLDGAENGFRGRVVGVSIRTAWNAILQTVEVVAP